MYFHLRVVQSKHSTKRHSQNIYTWIISGCSILVCLLYTKRETKRNRETHLLDFIRGTFFFPFIVFSFLLKTVYFLNKIKQLWTKYPVDLIRNVPRNWIITVSFQYRPLLWSCYKQFVKINIFHLLMHKSLITWVSEIPVQ